MIYRYQLTILFEYVLDSDFLYILKYKRTCYTIFIQSEGLIGTL